MDAPSPPIAADPSNLPSSHTLRSQAWMPQLAATTATSLVHPLSQGSQPRAWTPPSPPATMATWIPPFPMQVPHAGIETALPSPLASSQSSPREAASTTEAVSGSQSQFRGHMRVDDGKSVLFQDLCVFDNHPVEYFEMLDRIDALGEHADPFEGDLLSCKSLSRFLHGIGSLGIIQWHMQGELLQASLLETCPTYSPSMPASTTQ